MRTMLFILFSVLTFSASAQTIKLEISVTAPEGQSFPDGIIPTLFRSTQSEATLLDVSADAIYKRKSDSIAEFTFTKPVRIRTKTSEGISEVYYRTLSLNLDPHDLYALESLAIATNTNVFVSEPEVSIDELIANTSDHKSVWPYLKLSLPEVNIFARVLSLRVTLDQFNSTEIRQVGSIRASFKKVKQFDLAKYKLITDDAATSVELSGVTKIYTTADLMQDRILTLLNTLSRIEGFRKNMNPQLISFSADQQEFIKLLDAPKPPSNVIPFTSRCMQLFKLK